MQEAERSAVEIAEAIRACGSTRALRMRPRHVTIRSFIWMELS
jgi:hypothetical protein